MASAQTLQTIADHEAKSIIKQVMDLCLVVDKDRTGKIQIPNFMRITQATGLKVDKTEMMKFTNERENKVDYGKLIRELNLKHSGRENNAIGNALGYRNERVASPL